MPRQAWVILLGVVALQSCLCVSKTAASTQHPPSDNEATRSFRVAVIDPVTEQVDGAEERGPVFAREIQESAIKLYDEMMANRDHDTKLLASVEYNTMKTKVKNKFLLTEDDAISLIVKTFNKKLVAKDFQAMVKLGLNDPNTRWNANLLHKAQLQQWQHDRESARSLFRLLKLDDPNINVWKNPSMFAWKEFIDTKYSPVEGYNVLCKMMIEHSTDHRFADFIMHELAEGGVVQRMVAERFIKKKLNFYKERKLSPDFVYNLLGLHKMPKPLSSFVLRMWLRYVDSLRKDKAALDELLSDKMRLKKLDEPTLDEVKLYNPTLDSSDLKLGPLLFSGLRRTYGNEADLANAIIAYEEESGKTAPGFLTVELLKHWSTIKMAPNVAADLLKGQGAITRLKSKALVMFYRMQKLSNK